MKFTDGSWLVKGGYALHKPEVLLEYEVRPNGIHAVALCHGLKTGSDYTMGPALEYDFTVPREEMIRVRVSHFRGVQEKGPFFELNTEPADVRVEDTPFALILRSGRMGMVLDKADGMNIRFYFDDRLLTASGDGSVAYITDADYEASRRDDIAHRRPNRESTEETYLRERLTLDLDETIYGLGERFMPLVRNGQNVSMWNTDCGSDSEQGYKSIPFYLSSRGYGVLVNTPDFIDYEIGTESVRHVQFSIQRESLEYIVIGAEEPKDVLTRYTALTGRSPVPPAWSFGLWLSTSWITDFNAEQILQIIDRMADLGIPLSVFHFDARWMADFHDCNFLWHKRYGDPREMLRKIHERGVKVCCWINPYVSQPSRLFDEGLNNGYFLKKPDGSVWQTDLWMAGMAIVDFTNPEASEWYTSRLGEVLDMGVDCVKTDFGERLPTNVVYHDGSDPVKMHNYYTLLYNRAIYRLLEKKYGKENACLFGRSCTVGSQQFPVQWGGDNHASYVSMAESLRGGLSFCQSGFGFWSHDISGFNGTATPDLYKRWAAFGLLSTHSRLHGSQSPRMPWCFDEESCLVLAHFSRLKCSLMPYIYANAVRVSLEGQPEMRAMMLDFPNDRNCRYLDKQYMLGESLLVAPVFSERGEADFYVPEGRWTDYLTGEVFEGGRWHTRACDYFHLPLLVRPGSIVPRGQSDQTTVYDYAQGTTYQLFELNDDDRAECRVYDAHAVEAVKATAERRGDLLTFKLEGRDAGKPWKLLLAGIRQAEVTGAVAEQTERGLLMTPEPGTREIIVKR